MRAETEWVEIVESGAAVLCDADKNRILDAFAFFYEADTIPFTSFYGDGHAAERILNFILNNAPVKG
ncbi:UDP-N-acetylglucosamine 2-epimerase [Spirosoma fluviale]|uniref:UDP-N-acetylglucosamine 2-epimerase n=1 Tax=Spirosoma fluviale TaxID=1597977 RepID=UPI000BE35A77|nr:UDP-N-acetylglucosamine 2-epimerase [Spirosoma fluviale]